MQPINRRQFFSRAGAFVAGAALAPRIARAANNGTVVGSPTFGAAKFNNGLTATSDANYISLPSAVANAMVTNFGFDIWVNTTSSAGLEIALSFGSNWIGTFNGTAAFDLFGSGFQTMGPIGNGAWHHFAVSVASNNALRVFVDGALTSLPGTFADPGSVVGNVGRHQAGPGFGYSGKADELAVWSITPWTSSFAPPSSAYTGAESGLVALYHLESDGTDSVGGATRKRPMVILP